MEQIRKRHDAELIRQVRALLEENGMQVPAESTLRALFRLIPAGHAKEMKGLDPVYENHRKAFKRLDDICLDLHSRFSASEESERVELDYDNLQLLDMVQQAFKTCESYILGYFIYHLSSHDECANHCVNLACSDPNDVKFQENCTDENHDKPCDYCNLFPTAITILEELLEVVPGMDTFQHEKDMIEYDLENASKDIQAYKKQVFRHYVGSQTWDKYYNTKTLKCAMATMDFGMKWLPQKHRETSIEYFAKVSTPLS